MAHNASYVVFADQEICFEVLLLMIQPSLVNCLIATHGDRLATGGTLDARLAMLCHPVARSFLGGECLAHKAAVRHSFSIYTERPDQRCITFVEVFTRIIFAGAADAVDVSVASEVVGCFRVPIVGIHGSDFP